MPRVLLALLTLIPLVACAVNDTDSGRPESNQPGNQPLVVNFDAKTEAYYDRLIYVGSPSGYNEAFRRIFSAEVACPWGYSPRAHIVTEEIYRSQLTASPALAAELRSQIAELYSGQKQVEHLQQLSYVYGKASRYLVRVTVAYRHCDKRK